MGSFAGPNGVADAELQMFILSRLAGSRRSSIVPVNAMISEINETLSCALSDKRLAQIISEAAMLLDLVPVFDPTLTASGVVQGYGHKAHQPDPSARYTFEPGPIRTLPTRK